MEMTRTMHDVLAFARRNGGWVAAGTNMEKGRVFQVQAATLRALERRGFGRLQLSPDGGMALRLH